MKRTLLLTAVLIGLAGLPEARAQVKIGIVDPQAVLDSLPEKAAITRRLQEYQTELQTELQRRVAAFEQEAQAYESRKLMLTPERQREEEVRLGRLEAEIMQFEGGLAQLVQRRQNELMQPVLQELNAAIEALAIELGLDYVLNERLAPNQMPMVFVPGQPTHNLTSRVIAKLK